MPRLLAHKEAAGVLAVEVMLTKIIVLEGTEADVASYVQRKPGMRRIRILRRFLGSRNTASGRNLLCLEPPDHTEEEQGDT